MYYIQLSCSTTHGLITIPSANPWPSLETLVTQVITHLLIHFLDQSCAKENESENTTSNLLRLAWFFEAMRVFDGKTPCFLIHVQHAPNDRLTNRFAPTSFKLTAPAMYFSGLCAFCINKNVVSLIHVQHHSQSKLMLNMCFAVGNCKFCFLHYVCWNLTCVVIARTKQNWSAWKDTYFTKDKISKCAFRYSETSLITTSFSRGT